MTAQTIHLANAECRRRAVLMVAGAPDGWIITAKPETRTDAQNRHMWPLIAECREQVPDMRPFQPGDIKLRFLNALGQEMAYLPVLEGPGLFPVGLRSSKLSKAEFSDLLELIFAYGARHGVKWTAPGEALAYIGR